MASTVTEIHKKQISAKLSQAEIERAILEYVLRQHDMTDVECEHRTFLSTNYHPTGSNYEGHCFITINLSGNMD